MEYRICVYNHYMGTYTGKTKDEAILAYIQDAGYSTIAEAAEVLHLPANAEDMGITAEEI